MLRKVLQRVLSFSAIVGFAFAVLMLNPTSPSWVSEAQACEQEVYEACYMNCGFACYSYNVPECWPDTCNCATYCEALCRAYSGC